MYHLAQLAMLQWLYDLQLSKAVSKVYRNKFDVTLTLEDGSKSRWHIGPCVMRNDTLKIKATRYSNKASSVPLLLQDTKLSCSQVSAHQLSEVYHLWNNLSFAKEDYGKETLFYIEEDKYSVNTPSYHQYRDTLIAIKDNKAYWANVA